MSGNKDGIKKMDTAETNDEARVRYWIIAFLLLNALKLTVFNYSMMSSRDAAGFIFKFTFYLLLGIIVYSLVLRCGKKKLLMTLYVIESSYIFALLSYYCYFHNFLHIMQATVLFTESVDTLPHMTIPVDLRHLCILIDMIPFIYVHRHYEQARRTNSYIRPRLKYFALALGILVVSSEGWHYTQNDSVVTMVQNYPKYETVFVERYGTFISDIFNTVLNNGGRSYAKELDYGKAIESFAQNTESPNIVAIQVESLDANIVNEKHDGKYIAPYLYSLTESAIYYRYAMSYHLAGGTSDCEFSIINSVEPLSVFPSMKLLHYSYPNSFVKVLANSGYKTLAFHGNEGSFYNRTVAFKGMGFEHFYDIKAMGFKHEGWGAPDHEVFNYAANNLKDQSGPLFAYIITMSSHTPFTFTKEYYSTDSYNDVKDATVRNYFTSISYVDGSIKDFVKRIQSEHRNTYILIWGDHTPDIKKDEYMQASYTAGDRYFEFVPLFIITPDNKQLPETKWAGSFLDIAPTILKAAGIEYDYKSDGIDLLDPPASPTRIPLKEGIFDRAQLYKRVSETQK